MSVISAADALAASTTAETDSLATIVQNHMDNIALLINNETAKGHTHAIYQILENTPRTTVVDNLKTLGYTVWSAPTPYYPLPHPLPGANPFLYPFPAFYQYPTVRWDLIYIDWSAQ